MTIKAYIYKDAKNGTHMLVIVNSCLRKEIKPSLLPVTTEVMNIRKNLLPPQC